MARGSGSRARRREAVKTREEIHDEVQHVLKTAVSVTVQEADAVRGYFGAGMIYGHPLTTDRSVVLAVNTHFADFPQFAAMPAGTLKALLKMSEVGSATWLKLRAALMLQRLRHRHYEARRSATLPRNAPTKLP